MSTQVIHLGRLLPFATPRVEENFTINCSAQQHESAHAELVAPAV